MSKLKLALAALALAIMPAAAYAVPPGHDGLACTGTIGTKERTKDKQTCTWDSCSECQIVGKTINCQIQVVTYSNPHDCKPAKSSTLGGLRQGLTPYSKQSAPKLSIVVK